ncbi:hypothetical protein QYS49_06585 [Marivirga salinae]|uniref:Uncharacterized protein n=1 Tax=Marivirga salinarum TaxID=3059078 RepID=A0AA49GE63_9BACT|nr:hypothetical protein [Marivirga sp. BDSF4-3]WKK76914.2 hypothetical protein QYS49_06585 [Marivirga sp. BDSF4-3]
MNTKLIMISSSIILFGLGVVLTFTPDLRIGYLELSSSETSLLLLQIIGALYFAFAMLNWMSKANLIGGIYNRPIIMANSSHFMIAGLSLIKGLFSELNLPSILWFLTIFYILYSLIFGILLFKHPIKDN